MPTKTGNVLNWASVIDEQTMNQAHIASKLPFLGGHLALMPDAHLGKGATIGSVIPTVGAIIPSAVGVDLSCGLVAAKTSMTSRDLPDNLNDLHDAIAKNIPAGVGVGHASGRGEFKVLSEKAWNNNIGIDAKLNKTASKQLGSLGSGNHFVEVCLDEDDTVWFMIHSGSRGVGNQLAQRHIAGAKGLMKQYFIELEDQDLAYFTEGTDEFKAYTDMLAWATEYADLNRQVMMDIMVERARSTLGLNFGVESYIQCNHNFCRKEHHHGRDMWITRKGAVHAPAGKQVVIPGSMGDKSYIGVGLGNPSSYDSCSHGAGRVMSRSKAKKELDLDSFIKSMEGKSWNSKQAQSLLDEDPRSYKDIDQVMEDQKDLVAIQHELRQILNYKGV